MHSSKGLFLRNKSSAQSLLSDVRRLASSLERLTLRLGTGFCQFAREYGQLHLAIKKTAKMAKLTHLDLTYELFKGACGGYDNELGKGCPALKSFVFHLPAVQDYKHWKEVGAGPHCLLTWKDVLVSRDRF